MHDHDQTAAVLALLIPIVAIILGCGIAMLAIYLEFRRKSETLKLYHAQRMAAIEKGIELPALPDEVLGTGPRRSRHIANRNGGLVLSFLGAAITLALWRTAGEPAYWWGLVVVALGLALLLGAFLESRERKHAHPAQPTDPEWVGRE